jgi:hypothetical protein
MTHWATTAAASDMWAHHIIVQEFAVRLIASKPAKPRRSASLSSSVYALAMLMRQPLCAAPVPRFHIKSRGVDFSLFVLDRASGEQYQVYTPSFVSQFRAGYRADLWYVRRTTDVEITPRSPGFATASDAVEALRASSWSLSPPAVDRRPSGYRVSWSGLLPQKWST